MGELIRAIRMAHKVKDKPMHCKSPIFGNYIFDTEAWSVYKKARDTISQYPRIEKILVWWRWI